MTSGVNFKPVNIGDTYGNGSGQSVGASKDEQATSKPDLFAAKAETPNTELSLNDPIYVIFDQIDNQPLSKIAADFIKDNITTPTARFIVAVANNINSSNPKQQPATRRKSNISFATA